MPIPHQHQAQLRADIEFHKKRIVTFRNISADAQRGLTELRPDHPDRAKRSQWFKDILTDAKGPLKNNLLS